MSGVRGSDLADLLGDFVGDPAVDRLSLSLDLEGDFLVGDSATPFVVAYFSFSFYFAEKEIQRHTFNALQCIRNEESRTWI